MLINKKSVKNNAALQAIQKEDRRANRSFGINHGSILKININKVVKLSSEEAIGQPFTEYPLCSEPFDAQALLTALRNAKLTGNSGSGFPTAEKLSAFLASDVPSKVIIINGAECEPGLVNDAWLMRNKMKEIQNGAALLKGAFKPDRILLATRGTAEYDTVNAPFTFVRLPYRYPMGEEHALIRQALGIKLDKSVLPTQKGILVLNVQTVFQISKILSGVWDGSRFVTLADLRNGAARIAYVDCHTQIIPLLETAFGKSDCAYYAGGGIGRAFKIHSGACFDDMTAFAAVIDESAIPVEQPCIRCGSCTRKCPMHISVAKAVLAKQKNPNADVSDICGDKCVYCGACTYFCPAGKNPVAYFVPEDNT